MYLCSPHLLVHIPEVYWTECEIRFRVLFLVFITALKKQVLQSPFYTRGNWNYKEIKSFAPKVLCLLMADVGFELSSVWFSCHLFIHLPPFLWRSYTVWVTLLPGLPTNLPQPSLSLLHPPQRWPAHLSLVGPWGQRTHLIYQRAWHIGRAFKLALNTVLILFYLKVSFCFSTLQDKICLFSFIFSCYPPCVLVLQSCSSVLQPCWKCP